MCIVSNIGDYGRDKFPEPISPWNTPLDQFFYKSNDQIEIVKLKARIVELEKELEKWKAFKDLMDQADKVDALFDQKECIDPAKYSWYQDVLKRLTLLEDELKRIRQAFNGPG